MRFRKRIKICKGLSINLSKSGTSLTLGGRGASVNIGSKGTFVNTGIPGTGIYSRKKVGGESRKNRGPTNAKSSEGGKKLISLTITLDEAGKAIISDKEGHIITDENILRQIKRQSNVKEVIRKLVISRKENIEKANCDFIGIYKQTPLLIETESYESQLDKLKFEEYVAEEFTKEKPSIDRIKAEIESKARNPMNRLLFWRKKDKAAEDDPEAIYQTEMTRWQEEKSGFNKKETEKKAMEDAQRMQVYNQRRNELNGKINSSDTEIANGIDHFLKSLVLPVEFSMDYQYNRNSKSLHVDLDLPEIEDMPKKKAIVLSSGKLSIKPKTSKELKEDYARCAIGLAFYFAGNFFNISSDIDSIVVSGYTQRLSKKTGNIEDEYVYSINFDKDTFKKLNIKSIDPVEAIQNFVCVINVTTTYELKTIEPIGGTSN